MSDFDSDGDIDIAINNYKTQPSLYLNSASQGNWLKVKLIGKKSNRDAIGAIVRIQQPAQQQMRVVTAGDGYASQFSKTIHFGLGSTTTVDQLTVQWPSGEIQVLNNLPVNQRIRIEEGTQLVSKAKGNN